MAGQDAKALSLDPQPDERELHAKRLPLDAPGAELVSADVGLRIANAIWLAVNGDIFGPDWSPLGRHITR